MSDIETKGTAASLPSTNNRALSPHWNHGGVVSTQLIHQSTIMKELLSVVERVAPFSANVLVLGESGTGKEIIARIIHEKSMRSHRPFVAINCGALRDTLLESELFGHEKGSFTGAYQRKIGLAEVANGGTLFLDEVGELAPNVQAKLLRFLQEGEIYRVGGRDSIKVDIRLICATNRNIESDVRKGVFREDLYYRINTIVAEIPPLRRRKEDIPLLVKHFLNLNTNSKVQIRSFDVDPEALQSMTNYDWPGNVRELQNVCERLQILSEGHTIMLNDLPLNITNPDKKDTSGPYDPSLSLIELERRYILKALSYFDGNKTQAAQALGITIKTLYNKLHEYGEFNKFAIHSTTNGSIRTQK